MSRSSGQGQVMSYPSFFQALLTWMQASYASSTGSDWDELRFVPAAATVKQKQPSLIVAEPAPLYQPQRNTTQPKPHYSHEPSARFSSYQAGCSRQKAVRCVECGSLDKVDNDHWWTAKCCTRRTECHRCHRCRQTTSGAS